MLEVGEAVVQTDPERARACLRESRELSAALGYQSAPDLVWATGMAFFLNDRTATLKLGRAAIRGLIRSGDRLRLGITFHMIAGTLAASQPEVAAIILGAAQAHVKVESARTAQLITSAVAAALGEERARELAILRDHVTPVMAVVWSPGGVRTALALRDAGLLGSRTYWQLGFTGDRVPGGPPATARQLEAFLEVLPSEEPWAVHVRDGDGLEMAALAVLRDGHVSTGLGDDPYERLGLPTNSDLVRRVAHLPRPSVDRSPHKRRRVPSPAFIEAPAPWRQSGRAAG